MNIQDFHEKAKARATELAERLGVQFSTPDVNEVKERAEKRLSIIAKYNERKEEYDAVMEQLMKIAPPDILNSVIKNMLGNKN
jgi:Mn-dependent DtxR family transcriptional regulator